MKIFIIALIIAHYLAPFFFEKWSIQMGIYITTLIGLYVLVCVIPENSILLGWLRISTILSCVIGFGCVGDHRGESSPGCLLIIPGLIGAIIWIAIS